MNGEITVTVRLSPKEAALAIGEYINTKYGWRPESVDFQVGDVSNDPLDRGPPHYAVTGVSATKREPASCR